jgi:peptidyl-prolyl cis-trans isomerase A (cyclophilin A)
MRLLLTTALLFTATTAFAQTTPPAAGSTAIAPAPTTAEPIAPRVSLLTTEGEIVLELDPVKAPVTVENFLKYVNDGHYNGTIFHRVMPGFMAQGGGYNSALQLKPTRAPITLESKNGLRNDRGTVAMARTNIPDSATSQFFVNLVNNGFLNNQGGNNPGYAVFGKVVSGMDVVDKIAAKPTQAKSAEFANLPIDYIVIQKATVVAAPAAAADAPK